MGFYDAVMLCALTYETRVEISQILFDDYR